jgi:predicted PurR-regulated permease PerM
MEKRGHHISLDIFAFIAIIFIAFIGRNFIVPLLFAIILSVLIFPFVRFFESKICFNRIIAITISILLFTAIIFAVFVVIGIQFTDIMDKSDQYYNKIERQILDIIQSTEKSTGIKTEEIIGNNDLKVEKVVKENSEKIISFITASGSLIGDFVLTPLYMFFFLLYRNFLISFVYRITDRVSDKQKTKIVLNKLYVVQQNYLVGLFSVMGIVGLLNSAGLLLLGIDYPFFFGFLGALLLLIPYIGIIIGSLLPALIALATKDSYLYSIGVILIFGFVQVLEGNYITPKITGTKVSLNSFVSILAIVLFSMLWGIAGMILALPVTASLKIIFDNSSNFKALGFLLGEADDKYFNSRVKNRLQIWKKIRTLKLKEAKKLSL